jgi:hypothetical protein
MATINLHLPGTAEHPIPDEIDPRTQPFVGNRISVKRVLFATDFSVAQTSCLACAECPAQALCHDDSITGQVTRVLAERHPAIVKSVRFEALLGVTDTLTTV